MESKFNYSQGQSDVQHLDMSDMKDIADAVYGVDILNKKRYRNIVEARIIFASILCERGYSYSAIARFINKDHATMIYYSKQLETLLKHDDEFKARYDRCRDTFMASRTQEIPVEPTRPERTIINLKLQIEELREQRDRLNNTEQENHRLRAIIELVRRNTAIGEEETVYKKMNYMFNGIRK